jgi:hypothetical protein
MFSWSNLFVGLGMAVAGVCFVKFSYQILRFTGEQSWLTRFTGSGSTNGIYKIFGVLLVIVGILVATGFGNNVMEFIFGPFKNLFTTVSPH